MSVKSLQFRLPFSLKLALNCKIVAGALPCRVSPGRATPDWGSRLIAALHNLKPASHSPSRDSVRPTLPAFSFTLSRCLFAPAAPWTPFRAPIRSLVLPAALNHIPRTSS